MIWCVEDDASIRDIEVYALQSTGFEAKGFEHATSFWEALRTERPELVVLDVMLPGIDGMELLRRMRADAALSDIPVVMATAKGAEYDKIRGLDLGADYYLTKPFGVMELVSCVKAVLRRCGTKTAAQLRCGAAGRNGVADVLDLRRHVVAARADRVRPRKVEERIGLFRDQLRQRGQLRRIAGHHMQPRVLRQQRRPRAARVGDRVDRHALRQQLCTQRHPDCPRRTGVDGGVDLSLNACHF